jgi:hypothetical protein
MGAVLIVNAYGLFRVVPFVVALLVVSLLPFGVLTVLLPLLAIAGTALFLPLGNGNPYVSRLVRLMVPAAGKPDGGFIVQLTLSPRLRSGLRALLEDADDIGYLSFSDSGLLFQGDSVRFSGPLECIQQFQPQNVGLRGLYVYGRRIGVVVPGLPNVNSLEFAERSSWLLPTSRRITKQLCQHLSKK